MNPYEKAKLEALSQRRLETEIANLLGEGKTSEAYRVFEQLPLDSQLGISMAPGIGDALATFEVGEFKDRADKRFEQGDTLGGIGNYLLSGLSGLSLFPIVGRVPGAIGDVASKLGRNFRVPEGQKGGGSSGPDYSFPEPVPLAQNRELVFDYPGTRPSGYVIGDPDEIIEGLASPNRLALALFDQDEMYRPEKLVKKLKQKTGADKARELEKLEVVTPDGKLTEDFASYARNIHYGTENAGKLTPRDLDRFMRDSMNELNERTGEFSVQTQRVGQRNDAGFEDYATLDDEIQRVYKLDDIKMPKDGLGHSHYLGLFGKNVYGFDGVQIVQDGDKVVKNIARVQSDYEEALRDLASRKKFQGEKGNPFVKKTLIPEDIDIEKIVSEIKPDLEKAKKLTARVNNLRNEAKTKILFDSDGNPKLNLGLEDRIRFEEDVVLAPEDYGLTNNRLNNTLSDIQNTLKQSVFAKTGDPSVFDSRFPIKGSFEVTEDLMPGLKEAIDRVKFYAKGSKDLAEGPVEQTFNIGRLRFAQDKFDPTFQIKAAPIVDEDTPIRIKEMFEAYNKEAKIFNDMDIPKQDMFSTKTSTKSYIYPLRSNINESARLGHDEIRIQPERIFDREGGQSSPYVRSYYENIAKEAEKVAKELDLNPKEIVKRGDTIRSFKFQLPYNDLRKFFDIDLDYQVVYFKNGKSVDKDELRFLNKALEDVEMTRYSEGKQFDMSDLSQTYQNYTADAISLVKENAIGLENIDSIDDLGLVKIPLYRKDGGKLQQIVFQDGTPYYMKGNQQIIRQGEIVIDTKKIRSALEAGKKITLLKDGGLVEKDGGPADLQRRIDNL